MNKRGDSQIDWIISLALFLLYVAWFFIFIRPMAIQENAPNVVDLVAEKVQQNAEWTVLEHPVIIKSSFSLQKEPIVVDVPFSNQSNIYMINKSFFLVSNKLFFLSNVSGTTQVYVINSNETYPQFNQITDLSASQNSASAGGIFAEFENSTIKDADFMGPKIFSYSLQSGGKTFSPLNYSFINRGFAAIYSATTQRVNATTFVFGYNPRIYTLFSGNSSISESFDVFRYSNYYLSSSKNGAVDPGACYSAQSSMAELYTLDSAMLFSFSSPVGISICGGNNTISVTIDFNSSSTIQKIIFFSGNPQNFAMYYNSYSAELGIPQIETALSLFSLQLLNATNYNNLKNSWSVGDFRIDVYNATNNEQIIEIGGTPYEKANVYARETRNFLLDKYGNLEDVRISIQSWT